MTKRIALIVGSLRKESWNRKIANVLKEIAPKSLQLEFVEIGNLPLYNQDFDDENKPLQAWTDFRNTMREFVGVIFVTPEYNRSVPGVLKNALDVGSRPYGKSVWDKKAAGVVSSSPGSIGGFGANHHLRQCFVFLNVFCMQGPEAYISHVDKLFGEDKKTLQEDTRKFLKKFMDDFAEWVEKVV